MQPGCYNTVAILILSALVWLGISDGNAANNAKKTNKLEQQLKQKKMERAIPIKAQAKLVDTVVKIVK